MTRPIFACAVKLLNPSVEAAPDLLYDALPRRGVMTHLPASDPSDPIFWFTPPSARAAAQETANA